ncbi:TIGR03749 family integrating conjugative element protein [Caviibacterium pharyngocola]|uniref:TIGR03749 family integrating conjugative element protein n=1 Tax=Caviibacterium pharyngocola TaxID=28159 RepID=A0A2M8RV73_9PAST|nr:TIGR03749 family integrating conjugative element protein [Caviibacterium pharyngocola]PJG82781.1 TIGR03749 family integrating conjugative element protein [Caviibacterium pharyngocola]
MKTSQYLLPLLALTAIPMAQAEILMKWERTPLPIDLQVKTERIIFVDKNVRVGYPPELKDKLRIQSTGGAVYLEASAEFPSTRLQLRDVSTGEMILLDVMAKNKVANPQESIRFLYNESVAKQTNSNVQQDDPINMMDVRPNLPVPAVLTRYAAQMLYAPLRTVEPLNGVRQVAHRLPAKITTLLPAYSIQAVPLMSWQLDNYVVTAIRLQNRGSSRITLDPRELQGRFYAATFQHHWLGGYGSNEDTTTLYLVTEGFADKAIIPEAQKYTTPKKIKVKKTVKVTKVVSTSPTTTSSTPQPTPTTSTVIEPQY